MKRTQDKIKDYVEPQVFEEVANVAADPARALAAYRFTDATSDLLARWLDALADLPRGRGAARALAGARGVGKSHALAVFAALAGAAELRSAVDDAHVTTSARRLMNRRYFVVRVERGTRPSLAREMAASFAHTFGGDEEQWGDDPVVSLSIAASRVQEATLVLIIDTAFGREARVRRDDGPFLSQLASAAQSIHAFVALALDDDIADASGINSVLAGSFQIDYLDPEHLYRVADRYLLRKNPQARAALHEIYLSLRASVPGFNWSEPRFASLYPVHPLVADVAAAVRLYAPRFAFLPFAAQAATRAATRPALSLVLLDEVFDRTEEELRQAKDLQETFGVYDQLAKAISQFPVMQRLEAKLVLKSFFILSLDGRGVTAAELCAALLFSDDHAAGSAVRRIDDTLARFVAVAPPDTLKRTEEGGETYYGLKISTASSFGEALDASVAATPSYHSTVNELMRAIARARFSDWPLSTEGDESVAARFGIRWRGGERPGSFVWQQTFDSALSPEALEGDWCIQMHAPFFSAEAAAEHGEKRATEDDAPESEMASVADFAGACAQAGVGQAGVAQTGVGQAGDGAEASAPFISFMWQPGELSAEELLALRRLIALRSEAVLATEFGETAHAAASTLNAQAERIWARLYMDDSAIIATDGMRRTFDDEARAARTLAAALEETFAPLFAELYPEHPSFSAALSDVEVARLIDGFFGGASATEATMQQLAEEFALPLGLATMRAGQLTSETSDEALNRPWVREVLALADEAADGEAVDIERVRAALRRAPYGLLRETQNLVLAALVAQRRIELVTTNGDRISRRTLDRSVKWEEVAGVCRAAMIHHSAGELTEWARLLTANDALSSIAEPEARETVRAALGVWLEEWRARRVFEAVEALPDEGLTTRVWNLARSVRRSFGATADAIEALLAGDVSLEECLQRVADAFGDAAGNFSHSTQQLSELIDYTSSFAERERRRAYLVQAEPTSIGEIESARRELLVLSEDVHSLFNPEARERFQVLWHEFHARYAEHYAVAHDRTVGNSDDRRALDALVRSARWREFEALSQLPFVNRQHAEAARQLLDRANRLRCNFPVRQLLDERAGCVCAFRLARTQEFARLSRKLEETVEQGLSSYRRTLALFSAQMQASLVALADDDMTIAPQRAARARRLGEAFARGELPSQFSSADVGVIRHAVEMIKSPPPVRLHLPTRQIGLLPREELSARLSQWIDDLPRHTALVEIISESESDGA